MNHLGVPDFRRCERIAWVRQFVEAADAEVPVEFEGSTYELKIWTERVKNDLRYHILCEELKFMENVNEKTQKSLTN